jgi:hypothetical protein
VSKSTGLRKMWLGSNLPLKTESRRADTPRLLFEMLMISVLVLLAQIQSNSAQTQSQHAEHTRLRN